MGRKDQKVTGLKNLTKVLLRFGSTTNVCKGCMDDPWPVQYKSYNEALRENVYGVVEKLMEEFYGGEPGMNVQFGSRKEGVNGRNNWPTEGRPNRGYNGPVRRNGGEIREVSLKQRELELEDLSELSKLSEEQERRSGSFGGVNVDSEPEVEKEEYKGPSTRIEAE